MMVVGTCKWVESRREGSCTSSKYFDVALKVLLNMSNSSNNTQLLWRITENTFQFRVLDNAFIGLDSQGTAIAKATSPRGSETFETVRNANDPNRIRIKAPNGLFLQAKTEILVTADYPQSSNWGDDDPSIFLISSPAKLQGEFQVTNGYGPDKAASVMQMGAYPVFIVDGGLSPLKRKARTKRLLKGSGVNVSDLDVGSQKRNAVFARYIQECLELLELLGMPVIKAHSEAEALCAQLNREGHVDACMTADSDAFLYGATCVIKSFQSNYKEPFECYYLSDIEAALGLRRNQLIAISLLVGNDHDLGGLPGCGVDTAVRFLQLLPEDEILDRISEIGKGDISFLDSNKHAPANLHMPSSVETSTTSKITHCSQCGHPGNKIGQKRLCIL